MKVLIVRVGALGDVLHALPAVAALRAAKPGWQIDWVVDPRWQPLLVNSEGHGPIVNRIHLAETRLWTRSPLSLLTLQSLSRLRRDLRAARYDIAIDMQGTLRSAVIARMSGAPVRAGYADPREPQAAWLYTHKLPRRAPHVVEQGIDLLSQAQALETELGAPLVTASSSRAGSADSPGTTGPTSQLPREPWAAAWAAQEAPAGRRLALLAPGAGWAAKRWPASHFAALAHQLRAQGFDVALNAHRQDDSLAQQIVTESNGAARLVVCNVAGLIALVRRASLVVCGDSGPTHLAAALGIPLVALFGPTDPARNGPHGPGPKRILRHPSSVTSYKHTATPDPGLAKISADEVLQAALEVNLEPSWTLSPNP